MQQLFWLVACSLLPLWVDLVECVSYGCGYLVNLASLWKISVSEQLSSLADCAPALSTSSGDCGGNLRSLEYMKQTSSSA